MNRAVRIQSPFSNFSNYFYFCVFQPDSWDRSMSLWCVGSFTKVWAGSVVAGCLHWIAVSQCKSREKRQSDVSETLGFILMLGWAQPHEWPCVKENGSGEFAFLTFLKYIQLSTEQDAADRFDNSHPALHVTDWTGGIISLDQIPEGFYDDSFKMWPCSFWAELTQWLPGTEV